MMAHCKFFGAGCEEGFFMCNNQTCIEPAKRCDGMPDCGTNEDEENCATTTGTISLVYCSNCVLFV